MILNFFIAKSLKINVKIRRVKSQRINKSTKIEKFWRHHMFIYFRYKCIIKAQNYETIIYIG